MPGPAGHCGRAVGPAQTVEPQLGTPAHRENCPLIGAMSHWSQSWEAARGRSSLTKGSVGKHESSSIRQMLW